jgi:hypothetical protein
MKRPIPKAATEKAARDVALGGRRSSLSFGGDIVGDAEVGEVVGGGAHQIKIILRKSEFGYFTDQAI